jgi:translation initiation factor 3 subunit G
MEDTGDGEYDYGHDLPQATEEIRGDTKITTEYTIDEDGKRVKIVRYFRMERLKVSKSIAMRKNWRKFGAASGDAAGPNHTNTNICDDIQMDFVGKDTDTKPAGAEAEGLGNLKKMGKGFVKCRYCEMDHWSTTCPYKDKLEMIGKGKEGEGAGAASGLGAQSKDDDKSKPGKYVPPSLRDGGNRKGEVMMTNRSKDEANTIRVTNLPEDIQDGDIRELFQPFGRISRIFLAKDKHTGQSKGFAFVSFERRDDAQKAVMMVNGHGYANLILNVEWAKPSGN